MDIYCRKKEAKPKVWMMWNPDLETVGILPSRAWSAAGHEVIIDIPHHQVLTGPAFGGPAAWSNVLQVEKVKLSKGVNITLPA